VILIFLEKMKNTKAEMDANSILKKMCSFMSYFRYIEPQSDSLSFLQPNCSVPGSKPMYSGIKKDIRVRFKSSLLTTAK
jgi:hypothetical protein